MVPWPEGERCTGDKDRRQPSDMVPKFLRLKDDQKILRGERVHRDRALWHASPAQRRQDLLARHYRPPPSDGGNHGESEPLLEIAHGGRPSHDAQQRLACNLLLRTFTNNHAWLLNGQRRPSLHGW
jgi:hypothetical protein